MRYLLIGNPNVGKSSIFNLLTDTYAHVGNYGGVTVEQKSGKYAGGEILDLPGTYSVSPNSEDEGVVTKALLAGDFDGIINVVDSTHLKRNLHLTIELLETGVPLFIVSNMEDELRKSGKYLNTALFQSKMKVPVVSVSAKTKAGLNEVREQLKLLPDKPALRLYYGRPIEKTVEEISSLIKAENDEKARWKALQIIEGNPGIPEAENPQIQKLLTLCEAEVIKERAGLSLKGAVFNVRRQFINRVYEETLETITAENNVKRLNHKLDHYVTHPFFGSLIFLLIMFGIYFLTFDFLGNMISNIISDFINHEFSPFAERMLTAFHANEILKSLIINGIIAGAGGVLTFIPQIGILFFLLALLEGTGYMARLAIMLDTLFSRFGLNGKAIVPLVTGIGCNVPAVMSTRTIGDKRERLLTMMIIPFMSCSARIPIYALLAAVFFSKNRALVIISMYIIGTAVALLSAKLLSVSVFKQRGENFIIEIPPYRLPALKNVLRHTKLMLSDFVERAGKFILVGTAALWFLQFMGPDGIALSQNSSFLGIAGNFFAPVFKPLGFGSWESSSSLIIGFLAKELIFSSMIVIYGSTTVISMSFTGISAYSFMTFSLLYLPCLATVGTIYQETRSLKFVLSVLAFTFAVAYAVSFFIYHLLLLF